MKAFEISDLFRAQFAADITITGTCHTGQSTAKIARPSVVFEVTTQPMNATGAALTYKLTAWVESPIDRRLPTDDDPVTVHAARVEAVRAKLNGTGKDALLTALNASLAFSFRGWSAKESDPAVDDRTFRTPIIITGVALVL